MEINFERLKFNCPWAYYCEGFWLCKVLPGNDKDCREDKCAILYWLRNLTPNQADKEEI